MSASRWRQMTDWRFLVALGVLVLNDRWAKQTFPGLITGKVSDFVGMVVLPVVVATLVGMVPPLAIGLGERRIRWIALGFSGSLLFSIKTSATVARLVEGALHRLTGLDQAIVVDPTDLVGLVGLLVSYRVLRRSRPIEFSRARMVAGRAALGVGLLACAATSFDDDAGWTKLEVQDDDRIEASGPERASIVSRDGGRTWSAGGSDPGEIESDTGTGTGTGTGTAPVCLTRDPNRCVRTSQAGDLTFIEESPDGGESWARVVTSERAAPWVTTQFAYNASIAFGDIVRLDDDTILVSGAHLEPLRRDADTGDRNPTMAEVKKVPKRFVAVALVCAFPLFGAVRRFRAGSAEGVVWIAGSLVAGSAAAIASVDSVGPGVAAGVPTVIVVLLVLGAMAEHRWKSSGSPAGRPPVIVAALALALVVSTPFMLFGQDLLSWDAALKATQAAVLAGAVAAGFIGTPVGRRLPPPVPGLPGR